MTAVIRVKTGEIAITSVANTLTTSATTGAAHMVVRVINIGPTAAQVNVTPVGGANLSVTVAPNGGVAHIDKLVSDSMTSNNAANCLGSVITYSY